MAGIAERTAHTGYWLRTISNAVSQDFARRIAQEGVTVAEWNFMRSLYDAPAMAPSVLADKMGMTRGAISKLADRLLAKGLLARADDPADKRAHRLSLTEAGRAKVPVLAVLADASDVEYFDVLSPEERQRLDQILKILSERRGLRGGPAT